MASRALMMPNVEVTGVAQLYRAASVWTVGLCLCVANFLCTRISVDCLPLLPVHDFYRALQSLR